MIDTDPHNLWSEVRAAVENTADKLHVFDRQVRNYVTRAYSKRYEDNQPNLETHALNWMGRMVGQLLDRNPEVMVRARMGEYEQEALLYQHAMRNWIERQNLIRTMGPLLYDMMFNIGVAVVSPEPVPGMRPMDGVGGFDEDGKPRRGLPHAPVIYRIPQRRFFIDPLATSLEDARFFGHVWVRDRDDLLREAEDSDSGWNEDLISEMTIVTSETNRRILGRGGSQKSSELFRREVVAADVWLIEHELEGAKKGRHHGSWFTVPIDPVSATGDPTKRPQDMSDTEMVSQSRGEYAKKGYLREPRHMYGPRTGQYIIGGVFTVPDNPWPLGPLTATQDIEDAVNDVARANYRRARNWRQNPVVGGKVGTTVQELLNDSDDGDLLVAPGFSRNDLEHIERFGLNEQTMSQEQWLREKLARASTTPDTARGRISSSTATAVMKAEQASDTLTSMIQRRTYDFVLAALKTAGWYFWYDNRVASRMDEQAAAEVYGIPPGATDENGEPITVTYIGGRPDDDEGESYESLGIEIEPNSMSHTDEVVQSQNALAAVQFVIQNRQLAMVAPDLDWDYIYRVVGNALNQGSLRRMHNVEMAQQLGAMMMGLGAFPQMSGPNAGIGQPMFAPLMPGAGVQRPGQPGGNFGAQRQPMTDTAASLGASQQRGGQSQPGALAMAAER